jgi:hypothetical protein
VAALAGLAGAISYSHMRQLAQDHGQAGWHAHAFPLSVDGLEVVASLVLLAAHRSGRRPGWLPWAALVIGTAGSLAANVATAGPGTISRVIAGWPALALLIAVKLLSGLLNNRPAQPCPGGGQIGHEDASRPARPCPTPMTATRSSGALAGTAGLLSQYQADPPARNPALPADPEPGLAELLPAAREARDELRRDGFRLTRDALAARLRQRGYPVRNSRLTPLLEALRQEAATATSPDRPEPREQNPMPLPGRVTPRSLPRAPAADVTLNAAAAISELAA